MERRRDCHQDWSETSVTHWLVSRDSARALLCWQKFFCHSTYFMVLWQLGQSELLDPCSWFIKLTWHGDGKSWSFICIAFPFSVIIGWWVIHCPINDHLFNSCPKIVPVHLFPSILSKNSLWTRIVLCFTYSWVKKELTPSAYSARHPSRDRLRRNSFSVLRASVSKHHSCLRSWEREIS